MPLYDWKDKKTGRTIGVLREFAKYQEPPTKEEAVEEGLTEAEAEEAEWERTIGGGIQMVRGENWTGKKGEW
jgi:hypothetical protein